MLDHYVHPVHPVFTMQQPKDHTMARKRISPRGTHAASRTPQVVDAPQAVDAARAAQRPALKPGWQRVENTHLPRPTSWPVALAFAITLLAWGLVTTWIISAVGLILLAVSIGGWIGELLHEH